MYLSNKASNRREFLKSLLSATGQITLASSAIYSVSLLSSDKKFGQLTAGAKDCSDYQGRAYSPGSTADICALNCSGCGAFDLLDRFMCGLDGNWNYIPRSPRPGDPIGDCP